MTTPWCRPRGVSDLSSHCRRARLRFRKSKSVGAVFGLTCPLKYQSGESGLERERYRVVETR